MSLSRYFAPAVLAASLGVAAVAAPAPAQAQSNDLIRVLVSVADVVMRGNTPYYRNGDYSQDDRLIAQRDQYGRIVYYRTVPRDQYYGGNSGRYYGNNNGQYYGNDPRYRTTQPPYGNAYGYHRNGPVTGGDRVVKCNKKGKCKTTYYDPRFDRGEHDDDDRHDRDDRDDRWWDGRRWRDRDD